MNVLTAPDRESMLTAIEALQPGDCIRVECFSDVARNAKDLLSFLNEIAARGADFVSAREGIDTRGERRAAFFGFCAELAALDRKEQREKQQSGIDRARQEGKYKGRKPIAVDESLFDSVVQLWQDGQISARQAMARLDLKPNTFYRRIKEREEQKMKDFKKAEREIQSDIKEAAKQSKKDLDELKKQVRAEAKEVKKAAEEQFGLHEVERELRKDRLRAEVEHHDAVKQMKKEVAAETKELKQLLEES